MSNKKKYLLLFTTVIITVAAGISYYVYNKPAMDVQNSKGKKVVATELYATFTEDSATAKKKFANKILEVSGMVIRIVENQRHQIVALLKTNTEGAAINCTLEGPPGNIQPGHSVKIKGICNGLGGGDAELGIMGDVYLIRCYILK